MNSNTLRIRGSDAKKRIGPSFDPVTLAESSKNNFSEKNEQFKQFLNASSRNQVPILQTILYDIKNNYNDDSVNFLVVVYLQADPAHPAKGMISSFVTKNDFIQEKFTNILTKEIDNLVNTPSIDYKSYISVISKVSNCIENFPSGEDAMKKNEIILATYFKDCLLCCITTLSDNTLLAPTEKTEIYNLSHSVLRLVLYILQKISKENIHQLISLFGEIRHSLKHFMSDEDAPMDTKSVCGILYISMHIMNNGTNSWMTILGSPNNENLKDIMSSDSAKLSIFSALVTVIPMENLEVKLSDGEQAIMKLTNNILEIGERCSSDAAVTLGVSRALVPLSRWAGAPGSLLAALCGALELGADAVQHLAALALRNIVRHCATRSASGDEVPMDKLVSTLASLDRCRKSFYVSLTALINELGAGRIMEKMPTIVDELIHALTTQAVQASAATALETLLQKHIRISDSEIIFNGWIKRILDAVYNLTSDSAVLNILENLLAIALKEDGMVDFVRPYAGFDSMVGADMPVVVPLLLASAARRAGLLQHFACEGRGRWRGVLPYELLRCAAVRAADQERILCISLIVISPKVSDIFDEEELDVVLWFLSNNINAQSPHLRQLLLSIMKKFLKRLEVSYKWLLRENESNGEGDKGQYYVEFFERLRGLCFESLAPGANYSRRHVALQLLLWAEGAPGASGGRARWGLPAVKHPSLLDHRVWEEEQVEALLLHLADSYELNKALALDLLLLCPEDLLKRKKYSTSLDIKDIIAEASSIKPTDCVTAAYKLTLLKHKLQENVLPNCPSVGNFKHALFLILMDELEKQIEVCEKGIALGARDAPMYGILHCIGHVVDSLSPFGVPKEEWTQNIVRAVGACEAVWSCTSEVLASAAPEGHMPTDERGNIQLEDGKEVTAQMVLLCAWRSIKEVSLVLSSLVTGALLSDELPVSLRSELLRRAGELFTALLTETKHRGAFEQVYVGFSKMLSRLWKSSDPEFNRLPKQWSDELMAAIESGERDSKLCSTRRSAGLPFMMQALMITELQALPSASFDWRMSALLRLGGAPALRTRCHALNVLRALLRDRALAERGARHVPRALLLALRGFGGGSWLERNAATLLFGALMSRVFGVARERDDERPCVRNKMTGRIFFLKYPQLYDFMLEKLKEVSDEGEEQVLRPSLFPILLILARLYPSSLEGTVSNLKLSSFSAHVRGCACSAASAARRLAARAAPALVPPDRYITNVEEILKLLEDRNIKRNYCHGLLLQLIKILETKPDKLSLDEQTSSDLRRLLEGTFCILQQGAGGPRAPCYPLADEYIKMINIVLWKFDMLIENSFIKKIHETLDELLFNDTKFTINPGRELCLANAVYLQLIISTKYTQFPTSPSFEYKCLSHKNYEVTLAILNYLLMFKKPLDVENGLHEHLNELRANPYDFHRIEMKKPIYMESLRLVLKSKYSECTQKTLELLTELVTEGDLPPETVIAAKTGESDVTRELVIDRLITYIENENENLTHLYLRNLCHYLGLMMSNDGIVEGKLESKLLEGVGVILSHMRPSRSDAEREAASGFAEMALSLRPALPHRDLPGLGQKDRFHLRACTWSLVLLALHDELPAVRAPPAQQLVLLADRRQRSACDGRAVLLLADALAGAGGTGGTSGTDGTSGTEERAGLLAVCALLSAGAEVRAEGAGGEDRVFDSNEKYNIYMEETIWARTCARKIREIHAEDDVCEYLYGLMNQTEYRGTFEKLCEDNLTMFENLIKGIESEINPKVQIFFDTLKKRK